MRKLFCAYGLASAIVFALGGQTAVPNFAGEWTLDKNKSQGLAQPYKHFDRAFLMITQTDKEISLKETFSGAPVSNLPPARLGTGGGDVPAGPDIYKLDGSETVTQIGRSKYTRKAILSTDGKTLELIKKTTSPGSDGEVTRTSIDKLSLSDDGKVLTVIRRRDGPGPRDSTLVYNK